MAFRTASLAPDVHEAGPLVAILIDASASKVFFKNVKLTVQFKKPLKANAILDGHAGPEIASFRRTLDASDFHARPA
jgi:hypothetical protein